MEDRGYNLRHRPLSISVSDQSSFPISTIVPTADSSISNAARDLTPTMASYGQETIGSDSVQAIGTVAEPIDSTAASSGESLIVVNVATTASNVDFAKDVQQQAASVGVSSSVNVSGSVAVQASARADRPGVKTVTDRACDSEVSAYFRDSLQPPSAFHYEASPPRATSPFASNNLVDL